MSCYRQDPLPDGVDERLDVEIGRRIICRVGERLPLCGVSVLVLLSRCDQFGPDRLVPGLGDFRLVAAPASRPALFSGRSPADRMPAGGVLTGRVSLPRLPAWGARGVRGRVAPELCYLSAPAIERRVSVPSFPSNCTDYVVWSAPRVLSGCAVPPIKCHPAVPATLPGAEGRGAAGVGRRL